MRKALPNLLTLINLMCGSIAIASLFQGAIRMTLILALVALVADVLDGLLARLLDAQSEIGKQLDSLADLISFGLLPGSIVFYWLYISCPLTTSLLVASAAFLITAGSALRLAKFNLDTRQSEIFHGLPTPAATVYVLGLLLMELTGHAWVAHFLCTPAFLVGLIVLLPFLMLSDLRLWSLKKISGRNLFLPLGFAGIFILLWLLVGEAAISSMVLIYVITGILNLMFKFY